MVSNSGPFEKWSSDLTTWQSPPPVNDFVNYVFKKLVNDAQNEKLAS